MYLCNHIKQFTHILDKDIEMEEKYSHHDQEVLEFVVPVEDQMQRIIKVVGVGGGGCNAVRNMYNEGIQGVSFAVCNTDSASLAQSPVPVKIQLGEGLGAGAKPEVGRAEAERSLDSLEKLFNDNTKMVFVTATMGGGTGTGAAPVVARIAKERGLLTIGVVTIPFYFEHRRKIMKALKGVEELRKNVDAMLIINNERLCDIYCDTPISLKDALAMADNVLKNAVKGISELITISTEGSINLDFRDVETTMRNGGGAIMAIGRASGEHRVERAIADALDSPLLHGNDISRAKRILFNIYASDDKPIMVPELQEIDDFFDRLDPNIDVIWGTAIDDSLGEDAKVIILATDMEEKAAEETEPAEPQEKGEEYYDQLIKKLYKPLAKKPETKPEKKPEPQPDASSDDAQPPLIIEPVKEEEPVVRQEPAADAEQPKTADSVLTKLGKWIGQKMTDMLEEPEG